MGESLVLAISSKNTETSVTIAYCSWNGQFFREEFPFAWGIIILAAAVFRELRGIGGGKGYGFTFLY